MKPIKQLALLVILIINFSCSNDDENVQDLEAKEFQITINAVIDGDVDPYSFTANYITDNSNEQVIYHIPASEGGEVIITKDKEINAGEAVGVDLTVNNPNTFLTYITVSIVEVETSNIVYDKYFEMKTVVYDNPESWGTTKLSILHDIASGETLVEYGE